MENSKKSINWKSIFVQAIILSATIYLPFFIEDWNRKNDETELNQQYKEFLIQDLERDLADIKLRLVGNTQYLDTAATLMATSQDTAELERKAFATLMLGTTGFYDPTTNVSDYIAQFRAHGDSDDLKIIRSLSRVKKGFDGLQMIEASRYEFIVQYYTPIYLDNYQIGYNRLEATDLSYFNSARYINLMGMFYQLGFQNQILYFNTYAEVLKCLEVLGKDGEEFRLNPEDYRIPAMIYQQPEE